MSSLANNRRRPAPSRPTWLVALLVAVGALVVVGILFGVISLLRGSSTDDASAPGAVPTGVSESCVTTMVTPADVLPKPAKVKLNVYNATGTSGLAATTAGTLVARGFTVVKVGNDPLDKQLTGVGQIRYGPKGESAAQLMLIYFPGADLVNDSRKTKRVDVVVGEGFTAVTPEADVTAAMASPSPSPSGPGCASADAASEQPPEVPTLAPSAS